MKVKLALLTLVLFVAGCALNQSFSGRVTAGYAALAATNDTALVLVNAGEITKAHGAEVLQTTRAARQALDVANTSGDGTALEKALVLLRTAQAELCKGQETNPNCKLLLQQGAVL